MVKAQFQQPSGSRPAAATLAPFVKPEKPQVSPRLAGSFIKNGRYIGNRTVFPADLRAATRGHERTEVITKMCISIAFSPNYGAAQTQPQRSRNGACHSCTRSDNPAYIRGRPDRAVPICRDRHNYATR
jgi:hypothetical protein